MSADREVLIVQELGGFRTLSAHASHWRLRPPEELLLALEAVQSRQARGELEITSGEVATLRGEAPAALCERPLRRALREQGLERSLRTSFDWLVCAPVAYHDDVHAFAEVMLGVWCLASPPRDLLLPRLGLRLPLCPGLCAVFDPGQPHALLPPGQEQPDPMSLSRAQPRGEQLSWFVGFQLDLTPQVARHFRIGRRDHPGDGLVLGPGRTLVGSASGQWQEL